MRISKYIEQNLLKRPKAENKEWLANKLGVNYKTLCGWFKRDSFDGMMLTRILNVLEIDFMDFSYNVVPLSRDEIISMYKELYNQKQYVLEGMFVEDKKVYATSVDELSVDSIIEFDRNENLVVKLDRVDTLRLLKGYEVSKYIGEKEFILYMKKSGASLVQKILQQYDAVRRDFLNEEVIITRANVEEFLYLLEMGEYSYEGRADGDTKPILVEDENIYDERTIFIKLMKL